MDQSEFLKVVDDALLITIIMSLPVLVVTLVVGLLIGILQAVTQIQEATLTFVPKILITFITLIYAGPWMSTTLIDFTKEIFDMVGNTL